MPKKIPMRSCVGCMQKKDKRDLVRVIRTPEGEIKLDVTGRANGRGAYICPDPACLKKAEKKGSLSRTLEQAVPQEIYAALSQYVSERAATGAEDAPEQEVP